MNIKKKAASPGRGEAASKLLGKLHSISVGAWTLAYSLEESRQSHEAYGRHFRRLACCIGLAALRLLTGGLHHV